MKLNFNDILNNVLYENACSNICKEGGAAVKGVSRVKRELIIPTVNHFIKDYLQPLFSITLFGTDFNDGLSDKVFLFGSTGKKSDSGDIDIALDMTKFPEETIDSLLKKIYIYAKKKTFDREIIINTISNDMIHFAYPQYNENEIATGELVQVDLLFCMNPKFCKFFTAYPGEDKTKYKSAHRNELLCAIATVVSRKILVTDKQTYEILKWIQEDVHQDGVFIEEKTLIDDNGKRLKYKDTDEDLISSYAKIVSKKLLTDDPKVCIKRYVGNFTERNIDSFEKLYNIIKNNKSFKFAANKDDILYEAARRLKENTKLEFPEELL